MSKQSISALLLRAERSTREDRREAELEQKVERRARSEANQRRHEHRLEALEVESEAIDEEQRAKSRGNWIGWAIGTGGGTAFLLGPIGFVAGVVPAYRWGQIGSASGKFFSENERKAAADANHRADLEQVEMERRAANEREAKDRVELASFDLDTSRSFARELLATKRRAISAEEKTGPLGGSTVYRANADTMAASRSAISDAMDERRDAGDAAAKAKVERLQEMHRAERQRARSEANKSLEKTASMINAEIGMALSWCTFGISNACAQIANSVTSYAVNKDMEGVDRGIAAGEHRAASLERQAIQLDERAERASDRIEAERARLDQLGQQQDDVLRKMRG
jgi:hypothetical protein